MVKIILIILICFSNVIFSQTTLQSKVENLKEQVNEKKIIRKINFYKKWYWLTFRVDKDENHSWRIRGSNITLFTCFFKLTCPIDSSIYTKNLIDFLAYDKKEMFKNGYGATLTKNGQYYGSISIRTYHSGITASRRFAEDTLSENVYNSWKSLNPGYSFIIKGIGIVFIKNDSLKVFDNVKNDKIEIWDLNEYLKNKINLKNLYRYYHPLSKKEYKKLYGKKPKDWKD